MNTDFLHVPHPWIEAATLYVADVPGRVKWNHLAEAFRPCGQVRSGGRSSVANLNSRKKWTIIFTSAFEAEMALATLQGTLVPGVNPPFVLNLSHSPQLDNAALSDPLFPQFIHSDAADHPLYLADAQALFKWFRHAGPLVSVRLNIDVGRAHPACAVEYWDEAHANYAWVNCRKLCEPFKNMPQFSLRTYDACNLYCAKLGAAIKAPDLREAFGKFGQIVEARVVRPGHPEAYGFVSFRSRTEAERAMKEMNGKVLGAATIQVRYHEPKFQGVFRMPFKSRPGPGMPKPQANDTAWKAGSEETGHQEQAAEEEKVSQGDAARRREEELRERLEQERLERERQEKTRIEQEKEEKARLERQRVEREQKEKERLTEERRQKRAVATRQREEAQQAEQRAAQDQQEAEEEERIGRTRLADATRAHDDAKRRVLECNDAVREAERALEEARARRQDVMQESIECLQRKVEATADQRGAAVRLQAAVQEAERRRAVREQAEKTEATVLEKTKEVDEEAERQRELAESIRRMKELNAMEEAERREKAAKEQQQKREMEEAELRRQAAERLAQAQRERKEREEREEAERRRQAAERAAQAEQERKEREEKDRVEREKREKEEQEVRRQKLYEQASAKERQRCNQRDFTRWNIHNWTLWTKERGIDRFQFISAEFDELKFDEGKPLTFESIPWPVLASPFHLTVDHIEWSAVEEFFAAAKLVLDEAEYKAMVEKSHKRFHPDRWRSRGILNTVLDLDMRKRLEEAGNVVAQALTPIWLAAKRRT